MQRRGEATRTWTRALSARAASPHNSLYVGAIPIAISIARAKQANAQAGGPPEAAQSTRQPLAA